MHIDSVTNLWNTQMQSIIGLFERCVSNVVNEEMCTFGINIHNKSSCNTSIKITTTTQ